MQAPSYPIKVTTVELLREEHLQVDEAGKRTMRERGAIRVAQPGRKSITAYRTYNTKSGSLREFRGWLIAPSGKVTPYGKNQIVERSVGNDMYNEAKAKMLECDPNAEVGSVFAWEIVEEESTIFTTYPHAFQDSAPVLLSRFMLTLPQGWEMKDVVFNREDTRPTVAANTYTWEIRNLDWIEDEDYSPGWHSIAPRLALTYWPSGSAKAQLQPLRNWQAVSVMSTKLSDSALELTPELKAKAAALTSGAGNEWDKIRALAEYAQQVTYVSVQLNITRGGGYTPNPAAQVLSRNYGDCKDKAALMRALLKAIGIESYAISIFSGNREYVRQEWPSMQPFNHAILAVKVSPAIQASAVLEHPKLGRLLFFDPTDPTTPLGDLPTSQQGSRALVEAGENGELVIVPVAAASANRVERTVEATLGGDNATARMVTRYHGQSGSYWRHVTRQADQSELKQRMEQILSYRVGGVKVSEVTVSGGKSEPWIETAVNFEATRLGQLMQGRLLTISPGQLLPRAEYVLSAKERKQSLRISASVRHDKVRVAVPAGFEIDEIPDEIQVESNYGKFHAVWKSEPGAVLLEQNLELKDVLAPAGEYAKVRAFFDKVAAARGNVAVLVRK